MATIYHNPFSFADFRKPSTKMTVTIVDNNKPAKEMTSASAPSSPKESPRTMPFSHLPRRNSISTETPMLERKTELLTRTDLLRKEPQSVKSNESSTTESNINVPSIVLPSLPLGTVASTDDSPKKKKSRLSARKSAKPKHTRSKSESWEINKSSKSTDAKL